MAELIAAQCNDFLGGQDASKIPDRISDNCYAAGINVSTKRASLSPRWGFERLDIVFPEGGYVNGNSEYISWEELFKTGKFQLITAYPVDLVERLLIVIAGHIFLFNINSRDLIYVAITDGSYMNPRASRLNYSMAGKSMVIFDFPNYPVIVTGSTARRSDPFYYEVPVATNGTYNQNRLFIANAGNEFTAGDPVGSTVALNPPLSFEEVLEPGAAYFGQIFQLTTASANEAITAMGFLQAADTSTGIGPLFIATTRSIYTYNTIQPRSAWEEGQFGSLLVYNAGIVGPRAWINVNSDMFFLSADGYVRTLSMSRTEQARWSKIPISREVENWFKYSDSSLKQYAFVGYFNNKVFFSVNPYRIKAVDYNTRQPIADYANAGMVILELDNLTSFGEPSRPSWAGLWTGVNPMDMAVLNERAFIIAKDDYAINSLWEMHPDNHIDISGCNQRYIRSRIYTKEYDFQDPFMNKEVHSLDFNLDAIKGDFDLEAQYKPSHSPKFLPWGSVSYKAPWRTCDMPCNNCLNGYAHHLIRDLTIGSPEGSGLDCNPITMELYQIFKKVQLQITVTGRYWEIHEYRIKAIPIASENQTTSCEEFKPVELCEDCNDDWCVEDFGICQEQQKTT